MSKINFEEMANRWWVNAATPELTRKVRNKPILDAIYNAADIMGVDKTGLDRLLKQYLPRKSKNDSENVAYFQNSYKYQNERLTPISSGRFFKTLFPQSSDVMTEAFTLFWRDNISFNKADYKLVVGNTREDFKNAFTKYHKTSCVDYDLFKSISDSCMRYPFVDLPCHPSEVYASGDFEVVTVKSKGGKTRARCVVRVKEEDGSPCYVFNSIYASDNYSGQMVLDYIKSNPLYALCGSDGWHGTKLLKVYSHGTMYKNYVCPFVDYNRYVLDGGEHIVLVSFDYAYNNKKYEHVNSTSGFVGLYDEDPKSKYKPHKDTKNTIKVSEEYTVTDWI